MKRLHPSCLLPVLLSAVSACSQSTPGENKIDRTLRIGGECEAGHCELMYSGMPDEMNAADTSAGWFEEGQKLIVTGTAYQPDGKTPASGVIIYYHHTDNEGYYSQRNNRQGNQDRHGHLRGWMKTGSDGKYTLYTIRPAPYPHGDEPAHVHWLIKEPDVKNEYWTDDLMFEGDSLLPAYLKRRKPENRGSSGIVKVTVKDGIQYAEKNFVMGMNIPNYYKNE